MSLETRDDGAAVHYPKDPNRFEFDEEVAQIFPNMAERSIPMYREVHRLHASLLVDHFRDPDTTVVDLGASRGGFLEAICTHYHIPKHSGVPGIRLIAVDRSPSMLEGLRIDLPCVETICQDIVDLPDLEKPATVVSLFYVLQFMREPDARKAIVWAYRNLKKGGYLLLGQKEQVIPGLHIPFTEEYYRLRMRRGYTLQEIEAKTAALANSMWPRRREWTEELVRDVGFHSYSETSRWLQFSTALCIK